VNEEKIVLKDKDILKLQKIFKINSEWLNKLNENLSKENRDSVFNETLLQSIVMSFSSYADTLNWHDNEIYK
jgi:hypothetical protein